jgi:large subunit ribosomal protein L21
MAEAKAVKATKPRVAKKAPVEGSEAPKTAPKEAKIGYKYAVIMTGGKQYRVSPGDTLKIEKLTGDHKEGDDLKFTSVLLADNGGDAILLGTPTLAGVSVSATLKKIARYKTIDVIKYKQKSRYFKKNGHRQPYFEVQIDSIA